MSDDVMAETGPPPSYVDVADVDHFFRYGMNRTPEEARKWVDALRSAQAHCTAERDQGAVIEVMYDEFADLVDCTERLVEMWEDTTHILEVHEHDTSMQHPIQCRGDLLGCRFWGQIEFISPWPEPGRYLMEFDDEAVSLEPIEVAQ